MCGRYALSLPLNQLPDALLNRMEVEHRSRYAPRDLIVPGEPLLGFRMDQSGTEASLMLWGTGVQCVCPQMKRTPLHLVVNEKC